MSNIHPTACIAESAQLGEHCTIGPYAIIGEHVTLGDHCIVEAHGMVQHYVRAGSHNHIHAHAVIGGNPQDLGFDPTTESWLELGDHNTFREGVTINRATEAGGATRIGSHNFFMANSHIAHDCVVGDHNILANNAALAGHIHAGDRIFCGGGAMVHQFARIGSYAMIAGMAPVAKDVIPFTLIGRNPCYHYRLNTVGLRRAGIKGDRYKALNQAYRALRENKSLDDIPDTAEVQYLKEWLAGETKRGSLGFLRADQKVEVDI